MRLLLLTVIPSLAFAQGIISTLAGSDFIFPGDGKPALQAPLTDVAGVALDGSRRLYIVSGALSQVYRVDTAGILSTFAGNGLRRVAGDGGPARAASIGIPESIAIDRAGNAYIATNFPSQVRKVAPDGTITNFAGSGEFGFDGDNGPASRAALGVITGLAVDSQGSLYIADQYTQRIRRVDSRGIITTVAGNGRFEPFIDNAPALETPLSFPRGVAVDAQDNLYILDGNRVRQVGRDGVVHVIAGTGGPGFSGDGGPATQARFSLPNRIAVAPNGTLFIADARNNRVRRVTPDGVISTVAGDGRPGFSGDGGPATNASLSGPNDVALDDLGNLYIADRYNDRVRRVSPNGTITTVAGAGGYTGDGGSASGAFLNQPNAVARDSRGNFYVADIGANRVRRIAQDGTITTFAGKGSAGFSGDGGPATQAQLDSPNGVGVDAQDNVYIADSRNNRVRRVGTDGRITTFAGGGAQAADGVPATQVSISFPISVFPDQRGNVYVSTPDGLFYRIDSSGTAHIVAGTGSGQFGFSGDNGPGRSARLGDRVEGIAVDAQGNVYIGDRGNNRVRRIDTNGVITTVAGTGRRGTSGNGGPATAADVSSPSGLVFDRAGNLYIASLANVIRRVSPSGIITNYVATGRQGFSGDGGPALNATLNFSTGLASDPDDNLYIADYLNQRIRLVRPNPGPALTLSQRGLTISTVLGAQAPPAQGFLAVNSGQGTLGFASIVSTTSGGNWLSASPSSGSVAAGSSGTLVTVSTNPAGLAPGDYYGQIEVRAPGVANSPQFITVVLNILPTGRNAGVSLSPSGLLFTASPGGPNPASQSITVSGLSGAPVPFSATPSFGGPAWFPPDIIRATAQPTAPARVEIQPSISGLNAGVYNATLTFALSDGSIRRVELLLVLASGAGGNAIARGRAADCTPTRLLPVFTQLGSGFSATAAWPSPIEVRVVSDCGQPLTAGTVTASFSNGDPALSLTPLRDGRWSGTWQSRGAAAATVTVTGRAEGQGLVGTAQVTGGLQTNSDPPPVVAPGGVLNAASFALNSPVAPGSLVAIFGQRLAAQTAEAKSLPLTTDLGGALITVAGRALPLLFTSDGQINAQIPYDLAINARHQLIVRRGNTISTPEPLNVLISQAGVFSQNLTGRGAGIVVGAKSDGTQFLITPATPVSPGDALVIYCNGLGDVEPRVLAGQAAPLNPVATTVNSVRVTVGGREARVFFSGLTSSFVGLYQVNAFVPEGVPPGDNVEVVLEQNGVASPAVTISVR